MKIRMGYQFKIAVVSNYTAINLLGLYSILCQNLKGLSIFLFLFAAGLLNAQNLIINPSFEEFKKCPKELSQKKLKLKGGVVSVKGSPDYFNECGEGFTPYLNPVGNQKPKEGSAFVGLVLTSALQECNDREFIQLQLKEPLVKGYKYIFSMKVSLADASGYYTDQIGVRFLKDKIKKKEQLNRLIGKFDVSNPTDSFITNSKGWKNIKGLYNAKGDEKYIVIGNFQQCNRTSRKALLSNGMADSLKKYEDKNPHRGYKPSSTILDNMKRKLNEDLDGSTLKSYNLAYYFIDDLSLEAYKWNDSVSYLIAKEACDLGSTDYDSKNLVYDGGFKLNRSDTNTYWKTASKGTPDFLKDKVGLYLFSDVGKDNREYIISRLKEELNPCKSYRFSMKVKRNTSYKFMVDQLQAAVIDSSYYQDNRLLFPFANVISTPKTKLINHDAEWLTICGEFSPTVCSNYVIIGNFSSDDSTFILQSDFSKKEGPYAYYFIDDIELLELDSINGCITPCLQKKFIAAEDSIGDIYFHLDTIKFYFESSRTYTKENMSRNIFLDYLKAIQSNQNLQLIIEGHADKSGNAKTNEELSLKRALGVYKYLLQIGIPEDQLQLINYGSRRSAVSNKTVSGRAKNRRVEVYLEQK